MEQNASESARHTHHAKYRWFSTIKVTEIPLIKVLRKQLGYSLSHTRRDIDFYNVVRSQISTFKSRGGVKGSDLVHWRLRLHQDGLLEMASKFLDEDQKGPYYWPDVPGNPDHRQLQYSKDSKKIKRTFMQLVFRVNQQSKWKGSRVEGRSRSNRNSNRKGKARQEHRHAHENRFNAQPHQPVTGQQQSPRAENSTETPSQRDRNVEAPVGMGVPSSLDPLNLNAGEVVDMPTHQATYTMQSFQPQFSDSSQRAEREASATRVNPNMAPMPMMDDVYDGPHSTEPSVLSDALRNQNTGDGPASAAPSEENTQTQRRTRVPQEGAPSEDDDRLNDTTSNSTADRGEHRRTSSRPPAPRTRPDYVEGDAYSQISELRSPPSIASTTSSSTEDADEPEAVSEEPGPRLFHQRAQTEPPRRAFAGSSGNLNLPASHHRGRPPPRPVVPNNGAETATTSDSQHPPGGDNQGLPRQESGSLPKCHVMYSVNVSRNRNTQWNPKGKFHEKSLQGLLDELQPLVRDYEGLKFVLETPDNMTYDATIQLRDDDGFQDMKIRFNNKVKAFLQDRRGSNRVLRFEIVITPVRREGFGEHDDGDQMFL